MKLEWQSVLKTLQKQNGRGITTLPGLEGRRETVYRTLRGGAGVRGQRIEI